MMCDFTDMIIQGDIDLDPPYQRGECPYCVTQSSDLMSPFPRLTSTCTPPALVWSTPKQIKLIDSLFRNFYIPPVVFAVHNDRGGGRTRVCVDGQQRLRSIFHFLDGNVRFSSPLSIDDFTHMRVADSM